MRLTTHLSSESYLPILLSQWIYYIHISAARELGYTMPYLHPQSGTTRVYPRASSCANCPSLVCICIQVARARVGATICIVGPYPLTTLIISSMYLSFRSRFTLTELFSLIYRQFYFYYLFLLSFALLFFYRGSAPNCFLYGTHARRRINLPGNIDATNVTRAHAISCLARGMRKI